MTFQVDYTKQNNEGLTPLMIAQKLDFKEIILLIEGYDELGMDFLLFNLDAQIDSDQSDQGVDKPICIDLSALALSADS